MAERMMEYIPNALAFVFVLNASAAGGYQGDRVIILRSLKLLNEDNYLNFCELF